MLKFILIIILIYLLASFIKTLLLSSKSNKNITDSNKDENIIDVEYEDIK